MKDEILLMTIWMVPEGIKPSEISQRKKNTILFHSYMCDIRNKNKQKIS